MTAAVIVLSALVALEFLFAPVNLWTGRTMDNYRRFTGLSDTFATRWLAPAKLAVAVLVLIGLWWRPIGIVGAAAALAICGFYLVRLAAAGRRHKDGVAAFVLFGLLAAGLLVVRVIR
jgi:hypothetical protein